MGLQQEPVVFLHVSLEVSHTRSSEMPTAAAQAHGLPQWHVYFPGLFAFCLDVVRDCRMGPKCFQLPPLVASQMLSKGPSDFVCPDHPSTGINATAKLRALQGTVCYTELQEKMWDWEDRYAGVC